MGFMNNMKDFFTGPQNAMTDMQILETEYLEFNSSIQRRWMSTGERYYTGVNDSLYEGEPEDGLVSTETLSGKTIHKLGHNFLKVIVDEKVNYLLAKKYSLVCEDEKFLKAVKQTLGKRFAYTLTRLGYEASNKGIGWLQAYLDNQGALKFMVIPSEQCCPIWSSNAHDELSAMIRYYNVIVYEGSVEKTVTKLEYWTPNGLEFYEYIEGKLIYDNDAYAKYGIDRGSIAPHYSKDNNPMFWGMVPFVPFKNNMIEFPDIRFIKSLVDNYDNARSEVANFIEDVKNLVYVLKGYSGTSLGDFMADMKKYRAIKIESDTEYSKSGVETINPKMDITAAQEHADKLSQDIEKFSQSIPKDIEKLGSNPSGTALKFHYSGIDLKCNALETEFKFGFESLLYFIRLYLKETGQGSFEETDCDIIFNRDVAINTDAMITNCVASGTILSKKTILANHPFVSDVEAEIKLLKEEGR